MKLLNEDKKRELRKKLQANTILIRVWRKEANEGHSEITRRERERLGQDEGSA